MVNLASHQNNQCCEIRTFQCWCFAGGLCGVSSFAAAILAGSEPEVVPYEPADDMSPPIITLLGDPPGHVRAFDASGAVMIITTHETSTPYEDAGVFARDFIDGVHHNCHRDVYIGSSGNQLVFLLFDLFFNYVFCMGCSAEM